MQLFYQPDFKANQTSVAFNKDESRHITKVLRKKEGDSIAITNGAGLMASAELGLVSPKHCEAFILEVKKEPPLPYALHMAVAPTKNNDRFEWFLEKATEIGITQITPIISHHSERKQINWDRYNKIIVSAVKQSLKAYMPVLNPATNYAEFIANAAATKTAQLFIAHCHDSPKIELKNTVANSKDIVIAIGPEGDFSHDEVSSALDAGFTGVSLGEQRLRTETAAVVACTTASILNC